MKTLFDDYRLPVGDGIRMTLDSLRTYGERHCHWAVAWSGGKDSTTLVTLLVHFLEAGQLPKPKRLTILYADTRMELAPLAVAAQEIIAALRERGHEVRTVMAELDKRFLVYMLGRGVPPPNNNTFRWCTRQIKVDPMQAEVSRLHGESSGKVLMLTGVRQGESAIRDGRIAMSCGRDGAECGQGWYQEALSGETCATLAPLLHWRVCWVWDWLKLEAPRPEYGAWPTQMLADAYGDEDVQARTGCVGCPLANRDLALDEVLKLPRWTYLAPLKELRPIYRELREPRMRLRKPGGETRADGTPVANQHRMGPLTMDARRYALARILSIQNRINVAAQREQRPLIDLLNAEEVIRINELIDANTWPQKWSGDEPRADEPFEDGIDWLFRQQEGVGRQ